MKQSFLIFKVPGAPTSWERPGSADVPVGTWGRRRLVGQ